MAPALRSSRTRPSFFLVEMCATAGASVDRRSPLRIASPAEVAASARRRLKRKAVVSGAMS